MQLEAARRHASRSEEFINTYVGTPNDSLIHSRSQDFSYGDALIGVTSFGGLGGVKFPSRKMFQFFCLEMILSSAFSKHHACNSEVLKHGN